MPPANKMMAAKKLSTTNLVLRSGLVNRITMQATKGSSAIINSLTRVSSSPLATSR